MSASGHLDSERITDENWQTATDEIPQDGWNDRDIEIPMSGDALARIKLAVAETDDERGEANGD
ncbi:hypothetical protein [Glaciibacter psychrotolerans]|uniref:Uncharacterized protein n=1 Tax=Glaciibacter psychrotolerans TaxID=670054 RepID=A0A7Z0ECK2_9MICO|nr:hypothetical protein [Leifsonia psychrotolerans]NYJ19182.1 hypothetical protein [Leifsonia psychrotolerans]